MSSTTSAPVTITQTGMADFNRTTSRWGQITMIAGLLISLAGPLFLVFFGGLDITAAQLWIAFAAVAATFGIIWIVEPLTYYPVLGPAGMYQAFMIGNISSKLLPAALIAQTNIGAKPGSKRAELAAVVAICGAAAVHLMSLAIFVGLLGTWLISVIPPSVLLVTRLYVLPAVLGAVLVQAIVSMKQPRTTVFALLVSAVVVFIVLPLVPSLAMVSTAIAVLGTILLAWFFRCKEAINEATPHV
ncbi:hypothetical protein HP499_04530 [Paenarthrobacter sp. CM16]|uniref:hypothetical protein n=1 Tax=Paenarthrobacter sp. CM16 TaxID=2738447 RepID=UPI0015554E4A|nr:hypothetical protein [Paenarthrobacter sp. CM16]NQD87077.1 hypothetical protein [Paenarthrobacter sp. CM16]